MARANGERLIETTDYLFTRKASLEYYFQEIVDYIVPHKTDVTIKNGIPSFRNRGRRYDSTAVHSNILLSHSIHGSLTSESSIWFEMTLGDHEVMEDQEVKNWLADCSKRLFVDFNGSGFTNEVQEAYESLTGFGTTAIRVDENANIGQRKSLFTFETIPIREFVFTEGEDGSAESFYRRYDMTAKQIFSRWAKHPFFRGLTEEMQRCLKSEKASEQQKTFEIIGCIEPRDQYNPDGKLSLDYPIMFALVDQKTKKVIVETGYHEMNVMVPRWRKSADDDGWGTGQGFVAIADIRSLNEAKRLGFKAWAKDLDPPLVVDHKGVIGSIRTRAGGVIYKKRNSSVDYLQSGARWDTSQFNYQELKVAVQQSFYTDQLQLYQTPQMTATEAQIRYSLMMRILGPTYGRLKRELYNPMMYRTFNIALRSGRFKPMPVQLQQAIMFDANKPKLDVTYLGPMARAQRMSEIEGIQNTFGLGAQIAEATGNPEVLDNLDADEALRVGADVSGAPPKIVRDRKAVQKIRKTRGEALLEERAQQDDAIALDMEKKVVDIEATRGG